MSLPARSSSPAPAPPPDSSFSLASDSDHRPIPAWLVLSIATTLLFGAWAVLSKPASTRLGPTLTQALSTLGMLPVIALIARPGLRGLRTGRSAVLGTAWAAAAGLIVGLGNIAYFRSFEAGGVALEVIPFTALYPVVTVVLAFLFLGERPTPTQAAGLALSAGAIGMFVARDGGVLHAAWWSHALVPLVLWGAGAFLQKLSAVHASSELSTLVFLASFAPLSAALLAIAPPVESPSPAAWALVLCVGATFALGNLTLIAAFGRGGKASIVTPLVGLYPAAAIPLAVVFLGESLRDAETGSIDPRNLLAIALSLAAALCLAVEKKKGADS